MNIGNGNLMYILCSTAAFYTRGPVIKPTSTDRPKKQSKQSEAKSRLSNVLTYQKFYDRDEPYILTSHSVVGQHTERRIYGIRNYGIFCNILELNIDTIINV